MKRLIAVALMLAAPAFAWGPVLMGGAVVTLRDGATSDGSTVGFSNLLGPTGRIGFELGDRFNHEISFQATHAAGTGSSGGGTVPIDITTLAGRYTFSVDFFTKAGLAGFTPYLGVGLGIGVFRANTASDPSLAKWGPYLEFHAVAGLRYTFDNGFGIRAELVGSTYGGFFALQPTAGVAWRF